jgi:hypothetical protein
MKSVWPQEEKRKRLGRKKMINSQVLERRSWSLATGKSAVLVVRQKMGVRGKCRPEPSLEFPG